MFSSRTIEKIESEHKQELSNYNVKKMIQVLEKAIDLPVEDEMIQGVQRQYKYCISKIYDDSASITDDDREIMAEYFFRIEPLLKKVLFISNPTKFSELKANKSLECGSLLDNLHILESLRTDKGYIDLSKNPDKFVGSNNQEDHILRTYRLRNVTAHEMRSWNRAMLYSNIEDVMVTALFLCWKYKSKIEEAYDQNDINAQIDIDDYISSIIRHYKEQIENGFVFVPINWTFVPNIVNANISEKEMDITQLVSQAKENSHILLLGGAGCGKSTSIDYLEYNNAVAWKKNNSEPIPVKICLSETNENWISIEEAICDELGIPYDVCVKLLHRGGINLYLDGVNEMVSSREIKVNIVKQIERFLKDYKNVFVLISDRENVEIKIDSSLTTYYLHQMGEEDIRKFVDSKKISDDNKDLLINYANEKAAEEVRFTPIIINYLAEYLEKNGELPEDSTDLYVKYILYILDREYNEKKDVIAAPGRLDALLEYLAVRMEDNEFSYISTMRVFAQCIDYLHMTNMDSKNCLDLALQLGILDQDGEMIRFANEQFYYSLLAKGIELGMEEWNID